jgi:hypothetical protein
VVPGDDKVGEVRTFYANLLPEDIVDLALSPAGVGSRSDGADSSHNWFSVSDVLPEDPVQPDGTAFIPFFIPPEAYNDEVETTEGAPVTFNVLANDANVDGVELSLQVISGPDFGVVTALGNGEYMYTPISDFNGTDTFSYTITNLTGASDTATVTITVTGSAPWPPVRITSVVGEGVPSELTALRINFVSRTGKVYAVERSRDLVGWEVLGNIDGEEDSTEYTDTNPVIDGSAVFYRVREVE